MSLVKLQVTGFKLVDCDRKMTQTLSLFRGLSWKYKLVYL